MKAAMKAPFSVLIELQKYKLRGYDYLIYDVWWHVIDWIYSRDVFNFALTCTFFSKMVKDKRIKEKRLNRNWIKYCPLKLQHGPSYYRNSVTTQEVLFNFGTKISYNKASLDWNNGWYTFTTKCVGTRNIKYHRLVSRTEICLNNSVNDLIEKYKPDVYRIDNKKAVYKYDENGNCIYAYYYDSNSARDGLCYFKDHIWIYYTMYRKGKRHGWCSEYEIVDISGNNKSRRLVWRKLYKNDEVVKTEYSEHAIAQCLKRLNNC